MLLSMFPLAAFSAVCFSATDIVSNAEITGDQKTVNEILLVFQDAEKNLEKKQLSGIMGLYAKAYKNRGITKETLEPIWQDIFSRYNQLSSRHLFSKITVNADKGTAAVVCTGGLFGRSVLKQGAQQTPVNIDFWFEATHYLVMEKGGWKIIGHDPAAGGDGFGSAIHLLF